MWSITFILVIVVHYFWSGSLVETILLFLLVVLLFMYLVTAYPILKFLRNESNKFTTSKESEETKKPTIANRHEQSIEDIYLSRLVNLFAAILFTILQVLIITDWVS